MSIADPRSGEQRRDETLPRVRDRRPLNIWRAQVAMLEAMQKRADRTGTSDDMTPKGQQYKGNAPWLGAAVRQLAERGLIVRVGTVRSQRPSRKANEIKQWKLSSDVAATLKVRDLKRLLELVTTGEQLPLATTKSETPPIAVGGVSVQSILPGFDRKESNHG